MSQRISNRYDYCKICSKRIFHNKYKHVPQFCSIKCANKWADEATGTKKLLGDVT